MAQFNFTIRATDNEGSYADRAFSINVKNSRVERYCVTDANDAWTSPDGAIWTKRLGQGGAGGVVYGNNMWFAAEGNFGPAAASSLNLKKSLDGVNWTTINSKTGMTHLDSSGAPVAVTARMQTARLYFQNGYFFMLGYAIGRISSNTSMWSVEIARSSDGINWTWTTLGNTNVTSQPTQSIGAEFKVTFNNGTYFVNNSRIGFVPTVAGLLGWRSTDGVNWTQMFYQAANGIQTTIGWLGRINGMYFATSPNGGFTSGVPSARRYLWSVDGVNWNFGDWATNAAASGGTDAQIITSINNGSSFGTVAHMFYANGTIYAFPARTSTGTEPQSYTFWISTDGLNWTWKNMRTFNNVAHTVHPQYKNGVLLMVASTAQGTVSTNNEVTNINDNTYNAGIRFSQTGHYVATPNISPYSYGLELGGTTLFTGVAIIG